MSGRSLARSLLKMRKMSVAHAGEQLPVLLRRAEQLADDRDRVRLADVGDELARAPVGERVDEVVDDVAHERPQPSVARGVNAGDDEAAQAGVLVALHGQDRLLLALAAARPLEPPCWVSRAMAEWKRRSRRIAVTSSCRVTSSRARCGPASAAARAASKAASACAGRGRRARSPAGRDRGRPSCCSGGRTRTPNNWTRTSCVADYTTPEGGTGRLANPPADAHPYRRRSGGLRPARRGGRGGRSR